MIQGINIQGINRIGVSVANLDRSVAFYRDVLGMELVVTPKPFTGELYETILALPGARGTAALLQTANLKIELFDFAHPSPNPADPDRQFCDVGIAHFCIAADDIEGEYERLKAAGVSFHCPVLAVPGTVIKGTAGRDVDGNVFELLQRGEHNGGGSGMKRMDHIAVSVASLDRSMAFYRDLLGMEVMTRRAHEGEMYERFTGLPGAKVDAVFLKAGNMRIELLAFSHPSPKAKDPAYPVSDHGFSHFCLEVTGIGSAYDRLKAAGVSFHCPPLDFGQGKAAYARDPEGNVFGLIELSENG